jgi:hypothetical protein
MLQPSGNSTPSRATADACMAGNVLLLAAAGDRGAAAVAEALAERLPRERLRWVAAEALVAGSWSWRLSGSRVEASVLLPDGTRLAPAAGDVVLDRLPPPDPPGFAAAAPVERDYAQSEAAAVQYAWLAALPALVVNPPDPGPSWLEPGPLPWLALAARAGLPVGVAIAACPGRAAGPQPGLQALSIARASWDSVMPDAAEGLLSGHVPQLMLAPLRPPIRRVLVCAGQVLGEVSEAVAAWCLQLSALACAPLLEVQFGLAEDGTTRFGGATARPALEDAAAASFVASRLAALAA